MTSHLNRCKIHQPFTERQESETISACEPHPKMDHDMNTIYLQMFQVFNQKAHNAAIKMEETLLSCLHVELKNYMDKKHCRNSLHDVENEQTIGLTCILNHFLSFCLSDSQSLFQTFFQALAESNLMLCKFIEKTHLIGIRFFIHFLFFYFFTSSFSISSCDSHLDDFSTGKPSPLEVSFSKTFFASSICLFAN